MSFMSKGICAGGAGVPLVGVVGVGVAGLGVAGLGVAETGVSGAGVGESGERAGGGVANATKRVREEPTSSCYEMCFSFADLS